MILTTTDEHLDQLARAVIHAGEGVPKMSNATFPAHIPTWRDRLPAIFAASVATYDGSYAMTAPWLAEDGYVYATNGHLCVRTRYRSEFGSLPTQDKKPPAWSLPGRTFGVFKLARDYHAQPGTADAAEQRLGS